MSDEIVGHEGCAEFERASRLSRRGFMQGMAAGTGAMVATQMFGDAMMEASFAATGGNVLAVLSFRGGIDGLGVVKTSVLAADAMFGLHPEMAPLLPLWKANEMAAVHAVGMEVPNRSHFQAIELIEDSRPGSNERRGWVNRMIGPPSRSARGSRRRWRRPTDPPTERRTRTRSRRRTWLGPSWTPRT